MNTSHIKTISFRLILGAFICVSVLVSIFGIYDYNTQSQLLSAKQDNSLKLAESRLKLNIPTTLWDYDEELMINMINSEQQSPDISLITIENNDKEVIATSKGKKSDHFKKIKLQYIEDGEANDVGSAILYINKNVIEDELSSMISAALVKGVLLVTFMTFFLYLLTAKLVTQPIKEISDALQNIASGDGDLTERLVAKRDDEMAIVANSFNVFVVKIQTLVNSIQSSVEQTSSVSNSVSSASELSKTLLQDQLQETDNIATAMTQMASTANEISANAQLTTESADQASEDAKEVSGIIETSISSINGLSAQLNDAANVVGSLETDVDGIVSVLDVIRGIADQTNLLALNAAIEAARAGDQGRGFAVVADEVRALASRTQESTAEIQKTIERLQSGAKTAVQVMNASQEKSQASVSDVESSGASISRILSSTKKITNMSFQISTAAKEQCIVSEELSANINKIVDAGQLSLEQLNQMTVNSQTMEHIAKDLNKLSQQFKT